MAIEELNGIITPPNEPVEVSEASGWRSIESQLGMVLPDDYRHFVFQYGSGLLANFIRVFNPFSSSEYLALVPCVERICAIRRELKESEGDEEVPYDVYPVSPGLVPWGNDENGNSFYWLTEGPPGRWPTIVGEGRGRRWQRFDMTMTSFLVCALNGTITCEVWPASFPNPEEDCVFVPY